MSKLFRLVKSALFDICLVAQLMALCWRDPAEILPSLKFLAAYFRR